MKEAVVEQKVETYFRDRFPQFSVSPQCQVRFGTRKGGIADVVLHQPVGEENGYFVAIAECKKRPLPVNRFYARAQLKSYLSATHTRYGLLAIGTDPRDWEFCENKSNNWFASIEQDAFEAGIDNWKPVSVDSLNVSLQREQKAIRLVEKGLRLLFSLHFLFRSDLFSSRCGSRHRSRLSISRGRGRSIIPTLVIFCGNTIDIIMI